MDKRIKIILQELYELDPGLKQHERELVAIVKALRSSKPDTKFDRTFASELRAQLMGEEPQNKFNFNLFNLMTSNKVTYVAGGAVLAAVLIVPALYLTLSGGNSAFPLNFNSFDSSPKITRISDNAFGSLAENTSIDENGNMTAPAGLGSAEGRSFAGGSTQTTMAYGEGEAPADTAVTDTDAKMIVYPGEFTKFIYSYVGEDFSITEEKMEVLRKRSAGNRQGLLNSIIGNVGFNLVNFGGLNNPELENISFRESGNNGMRVNINFNTADVSMYLDRRVFDEQPYQPLTPEQMPSDETIIAAANAAIARYNINTESYGTPQVRDEWRLYYQRAEDKTSVYVPDHVSVVYPLKVNGIDVYDQGGSQTGIYISVNVRTMTVESINNVSLQQYDASLYDIQTDISTLINFAQNRYWYPADGQPIKEVTINLGTPRLVFTEIYKYDQSGESRLLVPAYVFPVIDKPADYYADNVIVPLVQELVEQPMYRILEADIGGGAAGSPTPIAEPLEAQVDPLAE